MEKSCNFEKIVVSLENLAELESQYDSLILKQRLVRRTKNKKRVPYYRLLKDIHIELSDGTFMVIPKGFEWDLSSVPKFLWGLLPPDGDFEFGTLIHDFLYVTQLKSRSFADKEMLLWCKAVDNNSIGYKIDIYVRFLGVRLFGGLARKFLAHRDPDNPLKIKK